MKLFAVVAAVLLCAACSTATNINVPKETKVQVSVPCVQEKPKRPELRSESDLMAMDRFRRTLATWSDYIKLWIYTRELEAVVEGCSKLGPPR